MSITEFDELAGRIEGIARAYQVLVGVLERQSLLDGQRLQAQLRGYAQAFQQQPKAHPAAIEAMQTMADNLLRDSLRLRGKSAHQIAEALQVDGCSRQN